MTKTNIPLYSEEKQSNYAYRTLWPRVNRGGGAGTGGPFHPRPSPTLPLLPFPPVIKLPLLCVYIGGGPHGG